MVLASSFANLRKSIEILETEFKLPLSMLLLSMPSLAGRSPVEALTNFPFLGMYTPEKIKRLEKIMNTVPDFRLSHIKLLKPIYNLHPDTMEERMEYALSNWPTVKYPGRTGEGPDPDHILLARGSPEVWRRTKVSRTNRGGTRSGPHPPGSRIPRSLEADQG
ncbi:unnamed protein product [Cyprideis torosa]|uniref:Uncharacterized protein n=1 Tax=Cyprideis torosa TaxID=163714 RepID=A0A7R8ZUN0_9CRUS|nr:unnamed protein product [Cyprideis torosa]CAG0906328.1 unnamed protein product [Cyprideis torosa]